MNTIKALNPFIIGQAAIKGLIDKNIVTPEDGKYHINDLFFTEYINR